MSHPTHSRFVVALLSSRSWKMALSAMSIIVVASVASADGIELKEVVVEPMASRPNLLDNPSFEQSGPNGIPERWLWDRRNTDATCTIDATVAHTGRQSIKLTNNTPFGAHVFGMLWRANPIGLTEGKRYTLSAWIKSDAPGIVNLKGGANWQYNAGAFGTDGQWRRISQTFTADKEDANFIVRIGTESPTAGVWIDDVKVEEGESATFDPINPGENVAPLLCVDEPDINVQTDGPFQFSFMLGSPKAVAGRWDIALSTGETLSRPVDVAAGVWRVLVRGESAAPSNDVRTLTIRLEPSGQASATATAPVKFYSKKKAFERIASLRAQAAAMRMDLEAIRSKGQDISYPDVTLTVLDNFATFAEDDANSGEVKRSHEAIDEMEPMAKRLRGELEEALASNRTFAAAPRWTGNQRPTIAKSSFVAPVRMADGTTVERPVFFTGFGHFGSCVTDMEKWPHYGTNIIQIEFGPNSVFPEDGVVSDAPMQNMRSVLDRAQKAGVAVCLLISPHYMPQWAFEKWPHLQVRRDGFLKYCLHAPESRELLHRFVTTAIEPLKDHPALHSICISNEPVNKEAPCESARKLWQGWLEQRHGDIATLNARYGASYGSWSDVPLPDPFEPPAERAVWMDFIRFNQEFFADWHQMLADAVHEVAPGLPVHAKAMTWTMLNGVNSSYGVDAALFAEFSDINGNDSINFYNFGTSEFAQGWVLNAASHDLQRSVLDAPVFNTENHIIVDRETRAVPAEHVRAALWQGAIHGQSATTIWVWERTSDMKSDLAGSIKLRPACTEAVGVVALDLNRAATEVTAIQQTPPQAVVLQSFTSSVYEAASYDWALNSVYTALSFTGLKLGFAAERQLEADVVPDAPLLFVPNVKHLSDAAMATLERYKGRVIYVGDGDPLSRNEYDQPRECKLPIERIALDRQGMDRELCEQIANRLKDWNVRPLVDLQEAGQPIVWGVERRSAVTPEGLVVNLSNARTEPATVTVVQDGKPTPARDVLTGEEVDGPLTLAPMEVRLLRLERE